MSDDLVLTYTIEEIYPYTLGTARMTLHWDPPTDHTAVSYVGFFQTGINYGPPMPPPFYEPDTPPDLTWVFLSELPGDPATLDHYTSSWNVDTDVWFYLHQELDGAPPQHALLYMRAISGEVPPTFDSGGGGKHWKIKWGDGFDVTDEGDGVIRVDA